MRQWLFGRQNLEPSHLPTWAGHKSGFYIATVDDGSKSQCGREWSRECSCMTARVGADTEQILTTITGNSKPSLREPVST